VTQRPTVPNTPRAQNWPNDPRRGPRPDPRRAQRLLLGFLDRVAQKISGFSGGLQLLIILGFLVGFLGSGGYKLLIILYLGPLIINLVPCTNLCRLIMSEA
jgi:predicted lipid-binding transport protein (Tim44 family)